MRIGQIIADTLLDAPIKSDCEDSTRLLDINIPATNQHGHHLEITKFSNIDGDTSTIITE